MIYSKKSLGQNFLNDQNIIKKITELSRIKNQNILEIGPGKGALTNEIIKKKPKSLILIEKDNFLFQDLKLKYKDNDNIKVYHNDILKFDLENKLKKNTIIFGNLPYNISSQILIKMIKFKNWPPNYSNLIFMFQKEMADRIIAKYGQFSYGRLSIITNYRLKILNKFNISPNCFFPKPKVNSTVLSFGINENTSNKIKKIENLEKITNLLFSNRRKMINKSIKKIFINDNKELVKKLNIDLSLRPSDLKPKKIYEITESFEKI